MKFRKSVIRGRAFLAGFSLSLYFLPIDSNAQQSQQFTDAQPTISIVVRNDEVDIEECRKNGCVVKSTTSLADLSLSWVKDIRPNLSGNIVFHDPETHEEVHVRDAKSLRSFIEPMIKKHILEPIANKAFLDPFNLSSSFIDSLLSIQPGNEEIFQFNAEIRANIETHQKSMVLLPDVKLDKSIGPGDKVKVTLVGCEGYSPIGTLFRPPTKSQFLDIDTDTVVKAEFSLHLRIPNSSPYEWSSQRQRQSLSLAIHVAPLLKLSPRGLLLFRL